MFQQCTLSKSVIFNLIYLFNIRLKSIRVLSGINMTIHMIIAIKFQMIYLYLVYIWYKIIFIVIQNPKVNKNKILSYFNYFNLFIIKN